MLYKTNILYTLSLIASNKLIASTNHYFYSPTFPLNTSLWYWFLSPSTKRLKKQYLSFINQWKGGLWTFVKSMVDLHFFKTFGVTFVFEAFRLIRFFLLCFLVFTRLYFRFSSYFSIPYDFKYFLFYKSNIKSIFCFLKIGSKNSFPRITPNLKEDMEPSTLKYNLY